MIVTSPESDIITACSRDSLAVCSPGLAAKQRPQAGEDGSADIPAHGRRVPNSARDNASKYPISSRSGRGSSATSATGVSVVPDQHPAVPRNREEHAAVVGARDQKGGLTRKKRRIEHQVGTLAGAHQSGGIRARPAA